MVGKLRNFLALGAYNKKADAKKKERSRQCGGKCFILPRKIKGHRRYVVLKDRGKKKRRNNSRR